MTAHRTKPTITQMHIVWFASYYLENPSWGIFHSCLDDGNWKLGATTDGRTDWSPALRMMAEWFDGLTPSQRRRLGLKARELAAKPWFQEAPAVAP